MLNLQLLLRVRYSSHRTVVLPGGGRGGGWWTTRDTVRLLQHSAQIVLGTTQAVVQTFTMTLVSGGSQAWVLSLQLNHYVLYVVHGSDLLDSWGRRPGQVCKPGSAPE